MKKLFLGIAVVLALGMVASVAVAGVGNKLPSGPHYNLNIIGAKTDKDVGDSNGHTLFVRLDGTTKIIMTQADDGEFKVVDRNGVDEGERMGEATFNIAPGYYNVYARALGKPSKHVDIDAFGWFYDELLGETLVWLGYVKIERKKGKPDTLNINELFYVDVSLCTATDMVLVDPDGIPGSGDEYYEEQCVEWVVYEDYWVFDIEELLEYFWNYDNKGLKLLQVRFYECNLAEDPDNPPDDYCTWPDGTPIISKKDIVTDPPDNWPPPSERPKSAPGPHTNVTTTWGDIKK
jgi:hypothetical protein